MGPLNHMDLQGMDLDSWIWIGWIFITEVVSIPHLRWSELRHPTLNLLCPHESEAGRGDNQQGPLLLIARGKGNALDGLTNAHLRVPRKRQFAIIYRKTALMTSVMHCRI